GGRVLPYLHNSQSGTASMLVGKLASTNRNLAAHLGRDGLAVHHDRRHENYLRTTVLLPLRNTRRSACHLMARFNTTVSSSLPMTVRSSADCVWSTRSTSCSMIGPSSRSVVT